MKFLFIIKTIKLDGNQVNQNLQNTILLWASIWLFLLF